VAFVFVVIALAGLALSLFITGKSSIKAGSCGRAPKQKDKSCGTNETCSLCEKDSKTEEKK